MPVEPEGERAGKAGQPPLGGGDVHGGWPTDQNTASFWSRCKEVDDVNCTRCIKLSAIKKLCARVARWSLSNELGGGGSRLTGHVDVHVHLGLSVVVEHGGLTLGQELREEVEHLQGRRRNKASATRAMTTGGRGAVTGGANSL